MFNYIRNWNATTGSPVEQAPLNSIPSSSAIDPEQNIMDSENSESDNKPCFATRICKVIAQNPGKSFALMVLLLGVSSRRFSFSRRLYTSKQENNPGEQSHVLKK